MSDGRPAVLVNALNACRRHIRTAAVFSLVLNVLYLAAPLYMLQVYDRVIASGSEMTLAVLTLVTLGAYLALAGLDQARAGVLGAVALRLDRLLGGPVFAAMVSSAARSGSTHQLALRDLDVCRQFVCGHGLMALLDLPWLLLYVLIAFGLHWAIGLFTLVCAAILVAIAVISEVRIRQMSRDAQARGIAANMWAEASLRNCRSVRAMAMMPGLLRRWSFDRNEAVVKQHVVNERTATMSSLVRFLRLSMQSLALGLGAYLVIERATSPGVIFAGSLLLGRALQPIEQIIGQWQNILGVRSAFERLESLLATHPPESVRAPAPVRIGAAPIVVENLFFGVPERQQPILRNINLVIEPGASVGLVGPSGAGKSSLVRMLAGAATPTRGSVRLGEIEISDLLRQGTISPIGYLPQDVELFDDSVAANISRFSRCNETEIARAAMMAGAHEAILALPQGYATQIGEDGRLISGGMRQRVALARAVFGGPRIVVLDEPSSSLDTIGDDALARCVDQLQSIGTTVILVSHRPATNALMHHFVVLIDGAVEAIGTRKQVLNTLSARRLRNAAARAKAPNERVVS